MNKNSALERVEMALARLRAGGLVILVDDEERENEGDLVFAAEHVTPAKVNFLTRFGRGLICLAMAPEEIERLALVPMVKSDRNRSRFRTAFTVSIEAATGVTTGISAADRARTIAVAIDPRSGPESIVSPGHIFPIRAQSGGVFDRRGQTEGSVDLARLAGLRPAAVICEILREDGEMARRPDLDLVSLEHDLPIVTVEDIYEYRIAAGEQIPSPTARVRVQEGPSCVS